MTLLYQNNQNKRKKHTYNTFKRKIASCTLTQCKILENYFYQKLMLLEPQSNKKTLWMVVHCHNMSLIYCHGVWQCLGMAMSCFSSFYHRHPQTKQFILVKFSEGVKAYQSHGRVPRWLMCIFRILTIKY